MSSRTASWRPALRIARRGALRARGRSALVAVMVGTPVALAAAVSVLISTGDVSSEESLPSRLGSSQARITPIGGTVYQAPDPDRGVSGSDAGSAPAATLAQVQALTGGRLVPVTTGTVIMRTGQRGLTSDLTEVDLADRAAAGLARLTGGRLPRDTGEIAVGVRLAARGVDIGDRVTIAPGAPLTVVGTVVGEAVALPGHRAEGDGTTSWLLGRATPVSWEEVLRLNRQGLQVLSRDVVEHPPPDSAIPSEVFDGGYGYVDTAGRAVAVIAITAIMIEVVLLAGPAMAVGARRRARQLALLVASGGDRPDVRRVVLADALVLGICAALAFAALGVAGAAGLVVAIRIWRPDVFPGPLDLIWWQVGAAAALGALAALIAGWAPARQAARADVVAALTGRRGQLRSRRGWPLAGAALAAVGIAGVFTLGIRPGGEFAVAIGTIVVVLGAVAAMPWLVGLIGRSAGRLPLALRLATRDASRNRSRTAPAAAAVMAAVAGVTVLAIGGASDFAQSRLDYVPRQPMGTTTLSLDPPDPGGSQTPQARLAGEEATWRRVAAVTSRELPGARFLPIGTVAAGTPQHQTALYVAGPGCPATPVAEGISEDCLNWQLPAADRTSDAVMSVEPAVMSPAALAASGVRVGDRGRAVLESGGVLVANGALIRPDGTVPLTVYTIDPSGSTEKLVRSTVTRVPAAVLPADSGPGMPRPGAAMTPQTAERLDVPVSRATGVLTGEPSLSRAQHDRLAEALAGVGQQGLYTERGFVDTFTVQLLALIVAAVLAVLIGTLTATGLALADARPDFATLSAVGAAPRTRRLMAGAHALTIGVLGAVAGIAVGFVPGLAVTWPLTMEHYTGAPARTGPVIDVPWLLLLGIAVVVPLLAAVVMAGTTRSRLALVRRLGE